ncbi:hypothetical protein SAMN04490357_0249 [Streptomyces misionensis]|uniref:Uncharacterized protein n=1 Tax=Streptomyces misionensis TaxID=67331 RepID=A0A1H4IDH7_9ACTN|nr:hypothetical protein [Streptomyces misionensis]SEB32091.1 hypothetical protein SAMN04490357_0249 [Streptomyces misionensis]
MQRAADAARAQVEQLRDTFGPPSTQPWSEQQTEAYETAWRTWRDLARDAQAAVTEPSRGLPLRHVPPRHEQAPRPVGRDHSRSACRRERAEANPATR